MENSSDTQQHMKREKPRRRFYGVGWGITTTVLLLFIVLCIGFAMHGIGSTLYVVLVSIPLEVVLGATASVTAGFDPISGALIASIAHLALAPTLITGFDTIVRKWSWLRSKLEKAEKLSDKYGKYGVWILAILAPIVGVFVSIAVGVALRFRPILVMSSVSLGTLVAAFLATMGGAGIVKLFEIW
ncbi:putative membrane protein [Pullulanibacillus pueri]|uniref:Small multi-drug export protein n=1 Tax=Pullulanibacillus pueri TaxID=1437324 RepID=A0A8J3ELH2_9BACL|nr:small multi-drug export protein [Pullulanibacillus pueri]MBM7681637.1 putative membrane protein [Pullulanibacillus pueri]GGH79358.1 hypothetical protein GCM10007096_14160 [Pullulanibacillus pueri]